MGASIGSSAVSAIMRSFILFLSPAGFLFRPSNRKILVMAKTLKELAFLRDLYVDVEWTLRFTELVDKHLGFSDDGLILYLNAGTGNHAIAIGRKIGRHAELHAVCEDAEVLKIARDKGVATNSRVEFSRKKFEKNTFDAVLTDASFVEPASLTKFVAGAAGLAEKGAKVAFFMPTAGSFGEVHSLLWEVFFNADPDGHGQAAEALVSEIPTIADVEEMARNAGLTGITTQTALELFEFKNGAEFIASPFVENFLMPTWLRSVKPQGRSAAKKKLASLIDTEDGDLTFRFTVKATLVVGEKS